MAERGRPARAGGVASVARLIVLWAAAAAGAFAQQGEMTPAIASMPKVELKGTVTKVSAAPGEGTPFVEVKKGEETVRVALGSMRYLMEHEFNPKAGDTIEVKGYQLKGGVVAIEARIGGGKTLAFRDSEGRPLWMRGGQGYGRGRNQGSSKQ